jgi:hypothetical protein
MILVHTCDEQSIILDLTNSIVILSTGCVSMYLTTDMITCALQLLE